MELVSKLAVDVRGPDGSPMHVQAGEVVVFYFSAQYCHPPTKQFTPLLAKLHALTQGALPDRGYTSTPPQTLHVIFVSSDKSEAEMQAYMAESHGRWSWLEFGSPGADELRAHFNVEEIPSIRVCSPSGASVVHDARREVMLGISSQAAATSMMQRWCVAAGVRPDVLPCGVRVELRGLKQEELNGQACEVAGADLSSDRVKVRTSAGRVIAVRRENCVQTAFGWVHGELAELRPIGEGYMLGDEEVAAADVVPNVGTVVRIEGLQAKPEKNGVWGVARGFDEVAGRVQVEVSPTEVLKLKPANLRI